jgi:hypothetical protein
MFRVTAELRPEFYMTKQEPLPDPSKSKLKELLEIILTILIRGGGTKK